jgi:ubiquitin C-terminal hydrolase
MGNCSTDWSNNNIKESWDYDGDIYIPSGEYKIYFRKLDGIVKLKEENKKLEIEIKGKAKDYKKKINEPFCYHGTEFYKKNNDCILFKIKNEQNLYKFTDNIIMQRIPNSGKRITGKLEYLNGEYVLDLELYLPKAKKEKQSINMNNYRYILRKMTNPIDIISNSVCGMNNLINTCYINSSFQILIHVPDLVEIIRKNNYYYRNNVIANINSIFNDILKKYKEVSPVIDPSIFVKNFKKEHQEYNNYYQMDSELFLEELIWNINLILSAEMNKRHINFSANMNDKEKLFWEYIKESEEDSDYRIIDLFYICFIHEKKCANTKCDYVSYYFDENTGLKLNFKKTNFRNSIDLLTLIKENYEITQTYRSTFVCPKCRKCFYIVETTRIAKLPKILIISLQKTNNENTTKIPCLVQYGDTLEIKTEFIDSELLKNGSCNYELLAINNHLGYSPKSGHYYSMIYLKKLQSWFSFNDTIVESISRPEPNLNNYILFYQQI